MSLLLAQNGFGTTLLIVGCVVLALILIVSFIKGHIKFVYKRARYRKSDLDIPASEMGRVVLDKYGLVDVEIKKGFGRLYNRKKKVIKTNNVISSGKGIISYTNMMQACALAVMDAKGDKRYPKYFFNTLASVLSTISIFVFVISFILSLISDYFSTFALVMGIITLAIFLFTFIVSIVTLRNQKVVHKQVNDMMDELLIFADEDKKKISELLKLYALELQIDTLLSALYVISAIIKIAGFFSKRKRGN